MSDKTNPIDILLERRRELMISMDLTRSAIVNSELRAAEARAILSTETGQLAALDMALTKLGYVDKEKEPPV